MITSITYILVDPMVSSPYVINIFAPKYSAVPCHTVPTTKQIKKNSTTCLTILSLLNNWESFWFNCFCREAICSFSWVMATTWSDEFGSCGSPLLLPAPAPPRDTLVGGPPSPPSFSPLGWLNFVTSTRCGRLLWPLCLYKTMPFILWLRSQRTWVLERVIKPTFLFQTSISTNMLLLVSYLGNANL